MLTINLTGEQNKIHSQLFSFIEIFIIVVFRRRCSTWEFLKLSLPVLSVGVWLFQIRFFDLLQGFLPEPTCPGCLLEAFLPLVVAQPALIGTYRPTSSTWIPSPWVTQVPSQSDRNPDSKTSLLSLPLFLCTTLLLLAVGWCKAMCATTENVVDTCHAVLQRTLQRAEISFSGSLTVWTLPVVSSVL